MTPDGWIAISAGVIGAAIVLFGGFTVVMHSRSLLKLAIVAVSAVLWIIPFQRIPGDSVAEVVAIAVLLPLAILVLLRLRPGIPAPLRIATLVLLATLATSTAIYGSGEGWVEFGLFVGFGVLGLVLGSSIAELDVGRFAGRLVLAWSVALSFVAILEVLLDFGPIWVGGRIDADGSSRALVSQLLPGLTRAQATLGHPLALSFVLLVAVALLGIPRLVEKHWLRLAAYLVVLAGIIASGSRSAFAVAVLIVASAALRPLRGGRTLIVVVGFAVGMIVVGDVVIDAGRDLGASGSYLHRLGALESVGRLVTERGAVESLLGSGAASVPALYEAGLLQIDGFAAVDNQLVFVLAVTGLLGFAAMLTLFFVLVVRSDARLRVCTVVLVLQLFVFEYLTWAATAVLAWTVIGFALSANRQSSLESGSLISAGVRAPEAMPFSDPAQGSSLAHAVPRRSRLETQRGTH